MSLARSDLLGRIPVQAGQRWKVRDGFHGAGLELYVVSVRKPRFRSQRVATVHARHPGWTSFERHMLPLDERWLLSLELVGAD